MAILSCPRLARLYVVINESLVRKQMKKKNFLLMHRLPRSTAFFFLLEPSQWWLASLTDPAIAWFSLKWLQETSKSHDKRLCVLLSLSLLSSKLFNPHVASSQAPMSTLPLQAGKIEGKVWNFHAELCRTSSYNFQSLEPENLKSQQQRWCFAETKVERSVVSFPHEWTTPLAPSLIHPHQKYLVT